MNLYDVLEIKNHKAKPELKKKVLANVRSNGFLRTYLPLKMRNKLDEDKQVWAFVQDFAKRDWAYFLNKQVSYYGYFGTKCSVSKRIFQYKIFPYPQNDGGFKSVEEVEGESSFPEHAALKYAMMKTVMPQSLTVQARIKEISRHASVVRVHVFSLFD